MEGGAAVDPGTGEITEKKSRWTYKRISEQDKTLAEKMVGRWSLAEAYTKRGDDWEKVGVVPGKYFDFMENGQMQTSNAPGTMRWSVNSNTGVLRMYQGDSKILSKIDMPDETNLTILTYRIENSETGETLDTQDKVILKRIVEDD